MMSVAALGTNMAKQIKLWVAVALSLSVVGLTVSVCASQREKGSETAESIVKPAHPELVLRSGPADWKIKSAPQPELLITGRVVRPDTPSQLFGFNINFRQFQDQLWTKDQQPAKGIVEALKPFAGALYRYPGGSVSNAFHWKESLGPLKSRAEQSSFYQKRPAVVRFGIDEYLQFVEDVNGKPWYVLNLVGTELTAPMKVADSKDMAESNAALARYLLDNIDPKHLPMPLQLGNELDRSRYEWTAKMYSERANAVIDQFKKDKLIDQIQPVNFMRDFRWKYRRDKTLTDGKSKVFMSGVLKEMGSDNHYSLHHYYDGDRSDGKSRTIPFWLRHLSRSIEDHKDLSGKSAQIWITEHGRQPQSKQPGKDDSKFSTSNVAAAISTADYLIALAQFAEVKGAVWHALNAGPWQMFDFSVKHFDLRPRPIYWGFRVLRKVSLQNSLESINRGPNLSGYGGGYDVRSAAFSNDDGTQLGIRVVNRASKTHEFRIQYSALSDKKVDIKRYSLSMESNKSPETKEDSYTVELEPKPVTGQFDKDGYLTVELQPSSVSSFIITSAESSN